MSKLKKRLNETELELSDLYEDEFEEIDVKRLSKKEQRMQTVRRQITVLASVGAITLIAIIVFFSIGKDDKKKTEIGTTLVSNETITDESGEVVTPEAVTYVLEHEKYPEITELVNLYYKATLKADTAAIAKYVDNIEEVNMDKIKADTEYIKKYKNIECYTMTGLYDNTFVVFAYYEIKFKNIETLAPAISMLYVIRDEETGLYYIHNGVTQDAELSSYVDALMQTEDVVALFNSTNEEFNARMEADPSLKSFVEEINANAESKKNNKKDKKNKKEESTEETTQVTE